MIKSESHLFLEVPGFSDLSLNDQMKLLQSSWTEVGHSSVFDSTNEMIRFIMMIKMIIKLHFSCIVKHEKMGNKNLFILI